VGWGCCGGLGCGEDWVFGVFLSPNFLSIFSPPPDPPPVAPLLRLRWGGLWGWGEWRVGGWVGGGLGGVGERRPA